MKDGDIVTQDGKVVGRHHGVYFYTLGQRRGLGIGGSADGNGERWFVLGKDVEKNLLIVSQGEDDILFKDGLETEGFNFITPPPAKSSIVKFASNIVNRYKRLEPLFLITATYVSCFKKNKERLPKDNMQSRITAIFASAVAL